MPSDPVRTAQEKSRLILSRILYLDWAGYAGHHETPNAISVDRHDPDLPWLSCLRPNLPFVILYYSLCISQSRYLWCFTSSLLVSILFRQYGSFVSHSETIFLIRKQEDATLGRWEESALYVNHSVPPCVSKFKEEYMSIAKWWNTTCGYWSEDDRSLSFFRIAVRLSILGTSFNALYRLTWCNAWCSVVSPDAFPTLDGGKEPPMSQSRTSGDH